MILLMSCMLGVPHPFWGFSLAMVPPFGPNLDSLFNTLHLFYQRICWTLKSCPLYAPLSSSPLALTPPVSTVFPVWMKLTLWMGSMLEAPPNFHGVTRLSSLFKADVLLAVTSLRPKETVFARRLTANFPSPQCFWKGRTSGTQQSYREV